MSDKESLTTIAEYYLRKGYIEDALTVFERLSNTNPDNEELYQKIGYCKQMKGDVQGALEAYLHADLFVNRDIKELWDIDTSDVCVAGVKDYWVANYAWNPYPVYRYRSNINHCINVHNSYRYVTYRSSYRAPHIYASRRHNAYERNYPNYSFSRRNAEITNRYELDRKRGNREDYTSNRNVTRYESNANRNYSEARVEPSRRYAENRSTSQQYSNQRSDIDYSNNNSRATPSVRVESSRNYSNYNRTNRNNDATSREKQYDNSNNLNTRENKPQRTEQKTPSSYENRRSESNNNNSRRENSSNESRGNRGINRSI